MSEAGLLSRLLSRIKNALIADMPVELDACEICRKTECSHGKWESCENRLNHMLRVKDDREKYKKS